MSEVKKRYKKFLIIITIIVIMLVSAVLITISQRNSIIKNIIISALAKQGFNNVTIDNLRLTTDTASIYDIKLSENIKIGYLQTTYKLSTNLDNPIIFGEVGMDKVSFKETKPSADSADISPIETVKNILSQELPVKNITIKSAIIALSPTRNLDFNEIRLKKIRLNINKLSNQINLTAQAKINGKIGSVYTDITIIANKSGTITAGLDIQKGNIELPYFRGKRISGWVDALYDNKGITSKSSLTIGSSSILGVPFQGISITHEDNNTEKSIIVSGKSPGDLAKFALALTASTKEKDNIIIDGKLDISMKKIKTLPKFIEKSDMDYKLDDSFKNIKGSADIRVNFKGNKSYKNISNPFIGWNDFKSGVSSTLTDLVILPNYTEKSNATIQASFEPIKNGVKINSSKLSFSYGDEFNYKGSIKAEIKSNTDIKVTEITGNINSSKQDIDVAIKKGIIEYTPKNKNILTSNINATINHKHEFFVPVNADIKLSYSAKELLDFKINITDKNKRASAKITGRVSTKDNKGFVTINMPQIDFEPTGTQPYHFIPSLKNKLTDTSGHISFKSHITLPSNRATGSLLLKEISTVFDGNDVKNMNTNIAINSFSPLIIKNQNISFESFNFAVPLYDALVKFSYDDSLKLPLHIQKASSKIANGEISLTDVSLNPKKPEASFDLKISSIALQQLFKLSPLEGLETTGVISGILPITLKNDTIFIENGEISANSNGILKYAPKDLPAFLQDSTNQSIIYLREVLNNFHYKNLSFTINGETGSTQEIKLHAEGENPDIENQRPIILNLNLQGALETILKQQTNSYTIPDTINQQMLNYEEKNE